MIASYFNYIALHKCASTQQIDRELDEFSTSA